VTEAVTRNQGDADNAEKLRRLHDAQRALLPQEILQALIDPDVTDIDLNSDGKVWLNTHSHGRKQLLLQYPINPQSISAFLGQVAGYYTQQLDFNNPFLSAVLPLDSSRLEAAVPPAVDAPQFEIRKKPSIVYTLDDYVASNIMTSEQADAVRAAVLRRSNILVSGGTGSGKTTLANAILHEIVASTPIGTRFLVLEDLAELQCTAANKQSVRTVEPDHNLTVLLKRTLRKDPDRVIIGEVRGPEAYDLHKALNTGHPGGLATIHANDARAALQRFDDLIQEAGVPSQARQIANSAITVVHIEGKGSSRRVREVATVTGLNSDGTYAVNRLA